MSNWGLQSPGEILDWRNDWEPWLEEDDTIATSDWEIYPIATVTGDLIDTNGFVAIVLVSDLQAGISYQLKNTITTIAGRTGIREITIRCAVQ